MTYDPFKDEFKTRHWDLTSFIIIKEDMFIRTAEKFYFFDE